jgi:drug/metabolite transporter (DMT)-like permease
VTNFIRDYGRSNAAILLACSFAGAVLFILMIMAGGHRLRAEEMLGELLFALVFLGLWAAVLYVIYLSQMTFYPTQQEFFRSWSGFFYVVFVLFAVLFLVYFPFSIVFEFPKMERTPPGILVLLGLGWALEFLAVLCAAGYIVSLWYRARRSAQEDGETLGQGSVHI